MVNAIGGSQRQRCRGQGVLALERHEEKGKNGGLGAMLRA